MISDLHSVRRAADALIPLVLGVAYVALLLATTSDLGYSRDEGFYFAAARSYEAWFRLLFDDPARALTRTAVDRYWAANHEHPALMKSLFALSHHVFYEKWGWFSEPGTAYRFPGMSMSALAVAVTYAWGRNVAGRVAGLVGALLFAMMPRIFYHAHLACFDMPVAAMWLVTTYAYWRSLQTGRWGWIVGTGLLYGLLLNTKHNSWLLPPALVLHWLIVRGRTSWNELRVGRLSVPPALLAMAVLGPLLFFATWPWIWFDTGRRFADYVAFHTGHEYYNMEFLGRTYWKPPFPRLYAWLMTAGTVPGITLLLFVLGVVTSAWSALSRWLSTERPPEKLGNEPEASPPEIEVSGFRIKPNPPIVRVASAESPLVPAENDTAAPRARRTSYKRPGSTHLLWLLCILTSYAPWFSPNTPIFGGTKHWITAYPFMALFAALGFAFIAGKFADLLKTRSTQLGSLQVARAVLLPCVVVAPTVITLHSHPWGLSAYTPVVGGAAGAASLGLNRTFWGYTTGAITEHLNADVPRGGSVFIHDTAMQSWEMLRADGRIREDIRGFWTIHGSDFALYHHEPHMSRVDYQIWVDYGTTTPAHIGSYDGVPVIWTYARPPAPAR